MRINPILAHLRAKCPLYTAFEAARSTNPVDRLDTDPPVGFVYALGEQYGPNQGMQRVVQDATRQFGVLTAALTAEADSEPLADAREQLRAALVGWLPSEYSEPVLHDRGDLIAINGRLTWWLDVFSYVDHTRE